MKKIMALFTLVFLIFSGCTMQEAATTKEAKKVASQLSQFSIAQPIPAFDWSFERDLIIQLYRLRNEKVATHTVWRSDYGMIEGDCSSIGYGLPYDTSLTNPLATTNEDQDGYEKSTLAVIEQQEPNGIYASKNTTATWVMSVDENTGQIMPLYIESKVTVYPYPVRVDYENNRVYKAGTASTVISVN